MARENNFLLGNGERLTSKVKKKQGPVDKNPPYTFDKAKERFAKRLLKVNSHLPFYLL